MTLADLARLAGTDAANDTFAKAVKNRAFTDAVILAQKKEPASLLALIEESAKLAESASLLLALLEQTCTPTTPTVEVGKLAKKVDKRLQKPFADSVAQRVLSGTLPASVGATTVRKKTHLYLKRMPPPKAPDVALAERLLHALESRPAGTFWTMRGLLDEAARDADARLLKKVLGSKGVKSRLLIAGKGDKAPVALDENAAQLAASGELLTFALESARTDDNQAVSAAELRRKVTKSLQDPFAHSLNDRARKHRPLPAGVGLLTIKKNPAFFFWSDVVRGEEVSPKPPVTSPEVVEEPDAVHFSLVFEQAFEALNRQHGGINLVNLVDLRRAVPVDRATFDRGLQDLRRTGRFSLTGAEGRHGLTPEEQEAAIREGEGLLLYVARRP